MSGRRAGGTGRGIRTGRKRRRTSLREDINEAATLVLSGLFAAVLLIGGIGTTVDGVLIATGGDVITGEVVATQYGTRGDFVRVRLDPPLDREVYLRAWSGRPPVGSGLQVRYRRSDPGHATDAGVLMPWSQMFFGLGGGLVSAIMFWATWRRRNLLDEFLDRYNKITIWIWVRHPCAGRATHRN